MSDTNTGGSAFPVLHWINGESTGAEEGMTLRDYFAAKAMQGLITSRHTDYENGWYAEAEVAKSAYAMADEMLEARKA